MIEPVKGFIRLMVPNVPLFVAAVAGVMAMAFHSFLFTLLAFILARLILNVVIEMEVKGDWYKS